MGSTAYADAIVGFGTLAYFSLLLILTFAAGYPVAVLYEKLFKTKVMIWES